MKFNIILVASFVGVIMCWGLFENFMGGHPLDHNMLAVALISLVTGTIAHLTA